MGNVRSLANKMDELTALSRSQGEDRECSLMCLTDTWLHHTGIFPTATTAFRLSGPTGIALRAVSVKEGGVRYNLSLALISGVQRIPVG